MLQAPRRRMSFKRRLQWSPGTDSSSLLRIQRTTKPQWKRVQHGSSMAHAFVTSWTCFRKIVFPAFRYRNDCGGGALGTLGEPGNYRHCDSGCSEAVVIPTLPTATA